MAKVEVKNQPEIILTLNQEEADMIRSFIGCGGSTQFYKKYQRALDGIYHALEPHTNIKYIP